MTTKEVAVYLLVVEGAVVIAICILSIYYVLDRCEHRKFERLHGKHDTEEHAIVTTPGRLEEFGPARPAPQVDEDNGKGGGPWRA